VELAAAYELLAAHELEARVVAETKGEFQSLAATMVQIAEESSERATRWRWLVAQLTEQMEHGQSLVGSLTQELDSLRGALDESKKASADLVTDMANKLEETTGALAQATERLNDLEPKVSSYETVAAERDALREKVEETQRSLDESMQGSEVKVAAVEAKLTQAMQDKEGSAEQLVAANDALTQARSDNVSLLEEVRILSERVEELSDSLQKEVKTARGLRDEVSDSRRALDTKREELASAFETLASREALLTELEQREPRATSEQRSTEYTSMCQLLARREDEVRDRETEAAKLRQQMEDLHGEVARLRQQATDLASSRQSGGGGGGGVMTTTSPALEDRSHRRELLRWVQESSSRAEALEEENRNLKSQLEANVSRDVSRDVLPAPEPAAAASPPPEIVALRDEVSVLSGQLKASNQRVEALESLHAKEEK